MLKRIMLTTDTVGGVWRYSLELAHGFAAQGIGVLLVTLGPPPNAAQRAEAAAVPGLRLVATRLPLDWLAETPAQLTAATRSFVGMAKRLRIDAVHLHTPALVGETAWPAPVVAAVHSCVGTWWRAVRGGPMPAELAWRADAVAQGIAAGDAVIAPSRSFAAALLAQYGVTRPIHTVFNARRPAAASSARNRHVLTAGRLWDAGKNVAAIDVAASLVDCPVLAAGPTAGPNGAGIDCRHLQLLGSLDGAAMATQFAAASVFVSVARYEPFGLAVLEAAQAGCALVVSDIPTFRELWDCAGIFVDPDDPTALADVLRTLTDSPDYCAHLGELAKQRAASFSADRMASTTLQIHRDLHAAPAALSAA